MTTKYLLRRAMADRLPPSVVNGKKRGFNVPMPAWLAGGLRDFTRDTLSPQRLRRQGLFKPGGGRAARRRPPRAPASIIAEQSGPCSCYRSGRTRCFATCRRPPQRVAAASI